MAKSQQWYTCHSMMQGSNENIKEIVVIISFSDYLGITLELHYTTIKRYLTISNKFFIPILIHYLRSYIKGCCICQLACNEKPPTRQLQTRINPNYIPLSRLSMDLKVMSRSHKGHTFILCITDEVTNYLITVSIY